MNAFESLLLIFSGVLICLGYAYLRAFHADEARLRLLAEQNYRAAVRRRWSIRLIPSFWFRRPPTKPELIAHFVADARSNFNWFIGPLFLLVAAICFAVGEALRQES